MISIVAADFETAVRFSGMNIDPEPCASDHQEMKAGDSKR